MTTQLSTHTFHIPVMGLAFTIDSPIRVAQYGIDSVISIADDELIEKMNAFYAEKFQLPYQEISKKMQDYRAKRITSYLNLVDLVVKEKFEHYKTELAHSKAKLDHFMAMLPTKSELKTKLTTFLSEGVFCPTQIKSFLEKNLSPGSIDVNIMTKLDKDNFDGKEQLPVEFNDAHAALRGFANSTVASSLVLSAGMNPRLFSYMEQFDVFIPSTEGKRNKKITLKVSDYRSALIQGNLLAKKGIWVSEYRIESGLNCGGHAFATDGFLLGPILEEFKQKKTELLQSTTDLLNKALLTKGKAVPEQPLPLKITVQGGVGTAEEHQFLLDYYEVDSVGWGSPFLLVPEATSLDQETRDLLANAKEADFYLSNISPLGVPFNTLKGTTNDFFKTQRIQAAKAGSSCPKKFLALSKEYDPTGSCTASKKYQDIKLALLQERKNEISGEQFEKEFHQITEKSCLCVGLANSSYLEMDIPIKGQSQGVVVCPGPNLAYFDKEVSLLQMVQHIYGTTNDLVAANRPHFFIKELSLYVAYYNKEIAVLEAASAQQLKKANQFRMNLLDGILYYKKMFESTPYFKAMQTAISEALDRFETELKLEQEVVY
ncbi:hypothetical protein [Flavobacterium sp. UBA6135]|uniref:hypothetical protein n=1 Tax=Flavobacterium sp. UBA6135 TaxID=1946553 RepID=UPI0025C28AC1|nr:hypothetical protein [Flavobacterium sp. UBA6135]